MRYHLIGIGGTGMGALAGLLRAAGHDVRGSDAQVYPPMSEQLAALEIPVFEGFSPSNLAWGPELVVVGNVCTKEHVEVLEAQRLGLSLSSLPAVLGEEFLAQSHSVVVAGTHGKTTTSSLLGHVLVDSKRDPGLFIGGVPLTLGKGWRLGGGGEFVVEGDEYDSAFFDKGSKFLHYRPRTAILTSVELDHVDIFSSMNAVRETFRKFVRLLPESGLLVVNAHSREAMRIAEDEARCRIETYSVAGRRAATESDGTPTEADWQVRAAEYLDSGRCRFELHRQGELFDTFETLLSGDHNLGNLAATIAVAHELDVPRGELRSGVSSFAGVRRRQEIRGLAQGVYVIDDYGHHPTAISETLQGLRRRFPGRRLVAAYEPRSATSRRKTFQREFASAFAHADSVVVGKLHAPEKVPEDQRFDPEKLALDLHQAGTSAKHIAETDKIVRFIVDSVRPGDVVVVFSSGSFDDLHNRLLSALGDPIMPARAADKDGIVELLKKAELEWKSLDDEDISNFQVLRNETGVVGCIALEVYGEEALLRSLTVDKSARSGGYGWMLADSVITAARTRGVRRIYLFTDSASDFFAEKLGFRIVDLSTVNDRVTESKTFQTLKERCPTAMRLDIKQT